MCIVRLKFVAAAACITFLLSPCIKVALLAMALFKMADFWSICARRGCVPLIVTFRLYIGLTLSIKQCANYRQ
jgi:hypothetical protein